jgi:hypothetical protein
MKHNNRRINLPLEITTAFFTLCVGFLGLLSAKLGFPDQTYIPISIGFLITIAAALLKKEMLEHIDSNSHIQSLLNKLEHEDLHKRGVEVVEACEAVLEELASGIISAGAADLFRIMKDLANRTRNQIHATHLSLEISDIYNWEVKEGLRNYYQANIDALNRNVKIERLFLIKKDQLIDRNNGQVINQRAIDIMKDQQQHGIKVFVTWLESVTEPQLIEDFIIFDNEEVAIRGGEGYSKLQILYGDVNVKTHNQRFSALKVLGQTLDELLAVIGQGT